MDQENNQHTTSQKKSPQNTPIQKNEKISQIVAGAFNVFNRYGKDSDSLSDIIRAFIEDLQPYQLSEIEAAFKTWRRKSDGMPAPANIINEIEINRHGGSKSSNFQKFENFAGSWKDYIHYLNDNALLCSKLFEKYFGGSSFKKPMKTDQYLIPYQD